MDDDFDDNFFVFAVAPIWKATDERKAKLKKVIAAITDNAIADYGFFDTEDANKARAMLFDACMACTWDNVYSLKASERIQLDGMRWSAVVTGGMGNWENHPNSDFGLIMMVGLTHKVDELLKQWSIEDYEEASRRSWQGFILQSKNDWIENYLKSNPSSSLEYIVPRVDNAIAWDREDLECDCGMPIWIAGSAMVNSPCCFTCITGESDCSDDYEIDVEPEEDTDDDNTEDPV